MDQQAETRELRRGEIFSSSSIRSRLSRGRATAIDRSNLQRGRPFPVASVCVGEHHVCVESPEHVAKTIAFNGGILNTDRRDRSAPPAV